MGKSYVTTINIDCLKEHTCSGCGAIYSYRFIRKVQGRARNPEASQRNAQASVQKTLATKVDLNPCPVCGIYQPDMIGQKLAGWHWRTFWLALIGFATVIILRVMYLLPANTALWIIFTISVLAALELFGKELKNFNFNLDRNRDLATDRIMQGKMKYEASVAATPSAEWIKPPRTSVQTLAGPLLLIAVLALGSAEFLRMAMGWPLNRGAYPPVVGPGDQTRIYMRDKIESINGFWRGIPQVVLTGPGGHTFPLQAIANENKWGSSISADSGEERDSRTPWVEMTLPQDSSLAGKTVACNIQLNIEYPQKSGDSTFETETSNMTQHETLHLAASGAGARYEQFWWIGSIAGIVIILITAVALVGAARKLQKKAIPTRILSHSAA